MEGFAEALSLIKGMETRRPMLPPIGRVEGVLCRLDRAFKMGDPLASTLLVVTLRHASKAQQWSTG